MGEFVQARLISDKANFWDPLKKTTSKPFFPIKPSKGKQALKRINLDRQVYSRLLVVSKDRDIDLGKDPALESLFELTVCRCKKGCNTRCSCRRVGLSCMAACTCENKCSNL